jgi:hypothetical protein
MLNHKKGAIWGEILAAIIVVVLFGALVAAAFPGIIMGFKSIFGLTEKVSGTKANYDNTFLFTAEDVQQTAEGCTYDSPLVEGKPVAMTCPKGKSIDFSIDIKNGGSRQLTLMGNAIICKYDDKDCCSSATPVAIITGPKTCIIAPSTNPEPCDAGSYTFDTEGKFKIYPLALCVMDQTYGCYEIGMSKPVPSCNSNFYNTLTIK